MIVSRLVIFFLYIRVRKHSISVSSAKKTLENISFDQCRGFDEDEAAGISRTGHGASASRMPEYDLAPESIMKK
ncbi:unnamed protein product [Thelazia callipaeda]|uniref:Ovule protein n=1 Tax=Thelazia callipaeda TaxID=103827 RepID=A0A0N5D9F6_THECL|nr:unnamed protein product [Thelazia callipaeda]